MKKELALVISFFFFSMGLLYAQMDQKIDITLNNGTLGEFLSNVESKTDYTFVYSNIDLKQPVTYNKQQLALKKILDEVLPACNVSYEIKDKHILLQMKQHSQTPHNISGTIKDKNGEPLVGVSIVEEDLPDGALNGTITDVDGKYSLHVSSNESKVKFSYIGFEDQVLSAGKKLINITMREDTEDLEEVVVIGYGQVKKSSLSASISTMKGAEIANKPVSNVSNSFLGRVTGISGVQSSGQPGFNSTNIKIRGVATTGNSAPLYVVDGVLRNFNEIDPSTIASMTILKDAAAVAPYGMGGANGVVLLTTKRGKSGAPSLSYNAYIGLQSPTKVPPMVNSYQYALMRNEAARNDGSSVLPFSDAEIAEYKKTVDGAPDADPDRYPNSNAYKNTASKYAKIQHHDLSLSGGTDFVKYYASLGYLNQGSQWSVFGYKRFNGQLSLDVQATKSTKVSFSIIGYNSQVKASQASPGTIMYEGFRTPPNYPIYFSNGLWGSGPAGRTTVGNIYHSGYNNETRNQLYTTFSITQGLDVLTKGLSLKALASYDPYSYKQKSWATQIPTYTPDFTTTPYTYTQTYAVVDRNGVPLLEEKSSNDNKYTFQGSLNYDREFGKHTFSLLTLAEARSSEYWEMRAMRLHYPINIDELNNGSTANGDVTNGGYSSQTANVGFVYRASYSYDQKYFLEASGRYDGSYLFAPGHRWGFFPSVSSAWNIAGENFIKDNYQWIDLLKLRASYGLSGNLTNRPYQFLTGYESNSTSAFLNGVSTTGIYERSPQANPNITWEVAKKFDIGFDGSFFNGLGTFQFDYFSEDRSNMLISPNVTVPQEYGTDMPDVNAGKVTNHGFELSLGSNYQFSNGLNLSVNGNLTIAKNKLVEGFETSATYDNPNRRRTGRALGTEFGYKAIGLWQVDDFNADGTPKAGIPYIDGESVQPGDIKYAKLSNDGSPYITANDKTAIGLPSMTNGYVPQVVYGFNPHLTWKGFDLDLLFQGVAGASAPIGNFLAHPFYWGGSATELQYKDHWTPEHTDALYPRLSSSPTPNNSEYSSFWVRDGSYIRFKSMELGYVLAPQISQRIGMQRLRLYVSGDNLFTWTPHIPESVDPEEGWGGSYYYQQRTFTIGLNVTF